MLAPAAPLSGDELVERAYKKVAEFVDLTPNEGAYHDAVQRGELRLELLFPHDAEEATRLRSHPALLWKVQNIREYLARKGKKRAKSRDDLAEH
jgi:hypothetical protein